MSCGLCGKKQGKLLRCAKCKVLYCCKEHQLLDWNSHKMSCATNPSAPTATSATRGESSESPTPDSKGEEEEVRPTSVNEFLKGCESEAALPALLEFYKLVEMHIKTHCQILDFFERNSEYHRHPIFPAVVNEETVASLQKFTEASKLTLFFIQLASKGKKEETTGV